MDAMTNSTLGLENRTFHGTGGVSAGNREEGFRPAFRDAQTGRVYASRFASGQPAPFHLLDGLPDELVIARHASGRVIAVKPSIASGFVRRGRFYTRDEAARAVAH
ncbi:MAG: hypothetical protein KDH15_21170 [Rhodocyclaceae bacterium]|nr:hypothetical protein [Rhodocyclaceae bacterium]